MPEWSPEIVVEEPLPEAQLEAARAPRGRHPVELPVDPISRADLRVRVPRAREGWPSSAAHEDGAARKLEVAAVVSSEAPDRAGEVAAGVLMTPLTGSAVWKSRHTARYQTMTPPPA